MKKISQCLGLILVSLSFSQCAGTMKLEKETPIAFSEVYTKSWVAGVKGGGSGTNIFIETKTDDIVLDRVYYRGKVSKLEVKPSNKSIFIGRFLFTSNTQKEVLLIDSDKDKSKPKDFPFQLEDNECVVSYVYKRKTKYYKLSNIIQRDIDAYPMSIPQNRN
ncbi:hypothetical protein [Winogradskyella sp.]|uniref:hypothetical protein n=1 Tax=Winogradskyella sp. TaxID=1883156 RepID=UPI0025DC9291|nr:hypothetical protein [Winogradskyella sp.]MBT8243914.1 hypothetical protein [Winogradskyella sp.]